MDRETPACPSSVPGSRHRGSLSECLRGPSTASSPSSGSSHYGEKESKRFTHLRFKCNAECSPVPTRLRPEIPALVWLGRFPGGTLGSLGKTLSPNPATTQTKGTIVHLRLKMHSHPLQLDLDPNLVTNSTGDLERVVPGLGLVPHLSETGQAWVLALPPVGLPATVPMTLNCAETCMME